jgi:hypothetical protein
MWPPVLDASRQDHISQACYQVFEEGAKGTDFSKVSVCTDSKNHIDMIIREGVVDFGSSTSRSADVKNTLFLPEQRFLSGDRGWTWAR